MAWPPIGSQPSTLIIMSTRTLIYTNNKGICNVKNENEQLNCVPTTIVEILLLVPTSENETFVIVIGFPF